MDTSITLFIDLDHDAKIDLRVAAKAALAWADLVDDVGRYFDPSAPPSLSLIAAEPGSQKVRALITSLSADPKANIRTAVVSSITFIVLTTATWTWEQVLEWITGPDAPSDVLHLSDDERKALARDVVEALKNQVGTDEARSVYSELSVDENVTGVGVTSRSDGRPSSVVARHDFPPQIYIIDGEGTEKRTHVETVDLVLLRPFLTTDTNKRWRFSGPHGQLGATIKDDGFLESLASGQLEVPMAEGIVFRVRLEISEEHKGGVWSVKEYAILRVLEVRAPMKQKRLDLEPPQDG